MRPLAAQRTRFLAALGMTRPVLMTNSYVTLPIQPLNIQNSREASPIDAGSVRTQAISKFRIVDHCRPDLFAHMVPATPEDKTCVVLTGNP